jgi:hypothetical protein
MFPQDGAVAQAWQLQTLAEASGVSRTLQACTVQTGAHLEVVLAGITQPFLDRAVEDLRQRSETLLLDADLTGRPVSSTSRTYPEAEFGYMDGKSAGATSWPQLACTRLCSVGSG